MFNRVIVLFFILSNAVSQNNLLDYQISLNCYESGNYMCSRDGFYNLLNEDPYSRNAFSENAQFYLFLSALKLYHNDTKNLFDTFLDLYPLSNKIGNAHFFMSEYLFEHKKYAQVVSLLSPINLYKLSDNRSAFFYLGYSAFNVGKNELAKSCFYEIVSSFNSIYKEDAIYYNSRILLDENILDKALDGFSQLKFSSKYSKIVPYYITTILFSQGKFNEIDNYLEKTLNDNTIYNYDQLVLLYAKSLYNLKEFDKSIVYFEESKLINDTLSNVDLYQIGTSYHFKGLDGFAINHLNKIDSDVDSLSQKSLYYLANSYIRTNNRHEAMNAFHSSSLIDFDPVIQHDSFYRFVILAYEQNSPLYDPAFYLQEFINKFPNSIHKNEVYSCLTNIYLNSSDYSQAILVLEKSNFENISLKTQYQKISFHKGVQLYNDGSYNDAINYFNKSIKIYTDLHLLSLSYYWLGETYFNLNMFEAALNSYKNINIDNSYYLKSLYSQGYCFMKLNDYTNAVKIFKLLINADLNNRLVHDIYLRLADSYFKLMKYQYASDFYNKAVDLGGFQADYALYKNSTALVLLEDYNGAIESFNRLINQFSKSNYIDDAVFDLGNVYILSKNYDLAINTFQILIDEFPSSLFYPSAHIKVGLVYYMQQKDIEAINFFKKVIVKFPSNRITQEALNLIKNIYSENGEISVFLDFISTLNHDYSNSELDSAMYYSAELQYMKSSFQNAINGFNSYLSYYPNGLFYVESNYFLSKSYKNIGDLKSAIETLQGVVNNTENSYTVDALLELARMSYEIQNYISSENYYTQLLNITNEIEFKRESILGILESKFHLYRFKEVNSYVNDSINDNFFNGKDDHRIKYLQAYSLFKMDYQSEALLKFNLLKANSDGALKAECSYYAALIYYYQEDYLKCEEMIFKLIKEFPNYLTWTDRSLLILAKNYIAKEDFFQAKHVLTQLLSNCKDSLIIEEVKSLMISNFPDTNMDSLNNLK